MRHRLRPVRLRRFVRRKSSPLSVFRPQLFGFYRSTDSGSYRKAKMNILLFSDPSPPHRGAAPPADRREGPRPRFAGPRAARVCRFIPAQRKTEICRTAGEGADLFSRHDGARSGRGLPVRRTTFSTRPFKSFFLRKRKYTLPPIGGRVYFV